MSNRKANGTDIPHVDKTTATHTETSGEPVVMADGGEQVQQEQPEEVEEESEEGGQEAEEAEEQQAETEEAEEQEAETEDEEEAEEQEAETEDEEEAEEQEAETEEEEAEEQEAETEEEEEAEEAETEEQESDEEAEIISLDLEGLFLNVLGLEVDLDTVQLDISAAPGPKRLVGNLLSALTGLADGRPSLPSMPSIPSPSMETLPLVSESDEAEGEAEAEGEEAEAEESEGGILSWLSGKIREAISAVIDALPLEEALSKVATMVIRALLERLEGADEEDVDLPSPTGVEA